MATASSTDERIDEFLSQRGHDVDGVEWEENFNKVQCPECGALHEPTATKCSVCGWSPRQSN